MITLRDYQEQAIAKIRQSFAKHRSALAVMPTGTGKTATASALMKEWNIPGDILFLAHRRELLEQTAKTYQRMTGEPAYLEQAEHQAPDRSIFHQNRRVIVGSVQTLQRDRLRNNPSFHPERFSLIVIDESHHSPAATYLNILEHFGAIRRTESASRKKNFQLIPVDEGSPVRVLGLTATPRRTDKQSMGQVFADCAYRMDIWDAVELGWLVPVIQKSVKVENLNLDGIKLSSNEHGEKDFSPVELEKLMIEEKHLHEVADATLQECGERQGIIFASGVAHAQLLKEVIVRRKPGSAVEVNGATDPKERQKSLEMFTKGTAQFLVNVGIATEGFDHPPTAAVIMARPTKSLLVYTQMLGRGTRPLAGCIDGISEASTRRIAIQRSAKPDCLILDFVGNSRHKLISAIDVLGGKYSARLKELAEQTLKANGGGSVEEAMECAKSEILSDINKEVRRKFIPKAEYITEEISPFNVRQTSAARMVVGSSRGGATDKQIAFLEKLGVSWEVASRYSKPQAGAVISELVGKRCTTGQAYLLRKHGYDPKNYNFKQAKNILDEVCGAKS